MHAASRAALAQVSDHLDTALHDSGDAASAAQIGTELFDVLAVLEGDRSLRVALADASTEAQQRVALADTLFGSRLSPSTAEVLKDVVTQEWSTPRELRQGLATLARRSLLRAAEKQQQLETVESELFQLSRLLHKESELTQLLWDRTASADARRGLLAQVLYGKVTAFTEALVLQAIGAAQAYPPQAVEELARQAAALRGREIAAVTAAVPLREEQAEALATKLGKIYGREMSVHAEVDSSLLGGAVIRVADEVIDGSLKGKLARLRASVA